MKRKTTFPRKSKMFPIKYGNIFTTILISMVVAIFLAGCGKEDIAKISNHNQSYQVVQTYNNSNMRSTCDLKTFTQGGWGAVPSGNNPGVYLYANFANAFPHGLTIGYPGGYTLTLTSAQAITNLLPCGGTAASLNANYIDPAKLKNVLAGQLVALTLSVGFDYYDTAFAASPLRLGRLGVASGVFQGMSIDQVLTEANKAFGGGVTDHSLADLVNILSALNGNFDGGTVNNGVVDCTAEIGGDNGGGSGGSYAK